jgi:hypothetical protein
MRKVKLMALAMGLSFLALHASDSAATTCEQDCRAGYQRCLVICSKNPCLISCEDQLRFCLAGCGQES